MLSLFDTGIQCKESVECKKMRNFVCVLLSMGLAASLGAGLASADEGMRMLSPEEFAVLPWGWTPNDPQVLETIRDCGFNLAGFVAPDALDNVASAGLKGIVSEGSVHVSDTAAELDDAEIERRVTALVSQVGGHAALFGYYLRDEPGAKAYPGLGKWAEAFRKADPESLAYINLFPNYASPAQMDRPTYEEYVASYVEIVQPEFISYDHYALMDDGSLRDKYFANLEIIRKTALQHDLPFWNIVLSNAHFNYAEPSPAGFRFQLYTTLAYGARGISYFTYFTPAIGNYRLGPIDQFGNKTPTWDILREVNLQLHRLGPIYITLKSVNVFHHPDVPEGSSGIETSRFIEALAGRDLMAGEFEDTEGRPFVMVVNKSLHHSTTFGVTPKEPGKMEFVNPYTGTINHWAGENNWLAPGQGMLLALPHSSP